MILDEVELLPGSGAATNELNDLTEPDDFQHSTVRMAVGAVFY